MKQPVERRLTAILAADVAGYSRLMGVDEEVTHERLKAHLRKQGFAPTRVTTDKLRSYGGIVNLTGCGQRDAQREAACANDYAAVITLLISARTRNVCVLEALCSAAVR
jgi:hypothetical protein